MLFFKKKTEEIKKPIFYEYPIDFNLEDVNPTEAKRLYKDEEPSLFLYFEPYQNGERYKAISDHEEIVGEIPIEYIGIIKAYDISSAFYFVDKKLNNEGKMEYVVNVHFTIKKQKKEQA